VNLPVADHAALVTQQHEVPVGQPLQQRGDIVAIRGIVVALRIGFDVSGKRGERVAWRSSSPSRSASVMKNGQLVGTVNVDEVTDEDILGMIILGKQPAVAA